MDTAWHLAPRERQSLKPRPSLRGIPKIIIPAGIMISCPFYSWASKLHSHSPRWTLRSFHANRRKGLCFRTLRCVPLLSSVSNQEADRVDPSFIDTHLGYFVHFSACTPRRSDHSSIASVGTKMVRTTIEMKSPRISAPSSENEKLSGVENGASHSGSECACLRGI